MQHKHDLRIFFFCFLNITGKSYVAQYISQLSFCNTVVPSRHREQQIYPAILAHIVHQQTRKMFHVKPTLFSFIERTWEKVIWFAATNGILSNFYWMWLDCDMATKVGGLILNNGLSAVPIFLTSLVFPCPGFHAPVFAMSFRGLTNSRGKIGTACSLMTMWKWEYGKDNMEMRIWKWQLEMTIGNDNVEVTMWKWQCVSDNLEMKMWRWTTWKRQHGNNTM